MDVIDRTLLVELQRDATQPQRRLAERVGLSQNACWRRIQKLTEAGILDGSRALVNPKALGLDLTVFIMIRTRHHDRVWAQRFRARVEAIPEITDFYRIGGEWDYMAKVVTGAMEDYDRIYKALIEDADLERVTGMFAMETLFAHRPLQGPPPAR